MCCISLSISSCKKCHKENILSNKIKRIRVLSDTTGALDFTYIYDNNDGTLKEVLCRDSVYVSISKTANQKIYLNYNESAVYSNNNDKYRITAYLNASNKLEKLTKIVEGSLIEEDLVRFYTSNLMYDSILETPQNIITYSRVYNFVYDRNKIKSANHTYEILDFSTMSYSTINQTIYNFYSSSSPIKCLYPLQLLPYGQNLIGWILCEPLYLLGFNGYSPTNINYTLLDSIQSFQSALYTSHRFQYILDDENQIEQMIVTIGSGISQFNCAFEYY